MPTYAIVKWEGVARYDSTSDLLNTFQVIITAVPTVNISKATLDEGIDVVSFLADTNIFPSKGEARKMLQNGGVSINRKKVENIQMIVDNSLLLHDKYLLAQKGKKNYYLIIVE